MSAASTSRVQHFSHSPNARPRDHPRGTLSSKDTTKRLRRASPQTPLIPSSPLTPPPRDGENPKNSPVSSHHLLYKAANKMPTGTLGSDTAPHGHVQDNTVNRVRNSSTTSATESPTPQPRSCLTSRAHTTITADHSSPRVHTNFANREPRPAASLNQKSIWKATS